MKHDKKLVLPLRKKIFLAIGFVLLFGAMLPRFFPRDHDGESEKRRCDDYCKKEYGLSGKLVRIIPNQTSPGAYEGPWKCTCPR